MTLARNLLLAAALALVLGGLAAAPEHPSPGWFVLAAGVVAAAFALTQVVRFNAAVVYLSWCEAALIIGLHLLPAGWVPLAVAAGMPAGVALRWSRDRATPLRRLPWNTASHAIAAALAAVVTVSVADPYRATLTPAVTAGLVLGAMLYFLVTGVLVGIRVGLETGVAVWRRPLRMLRPGGPALVRNTAVGLTAVAVAYADWRWLLALPVVLWLLHQTYAFRVRSGERRRTWSALTSATRSLNQPDRESVAIAGVRGAVEVFAVAAAELELDGADGDRRGWLADHTGLVRSTGRGQPVGAAAGPAGGTTVPLLVGGEEIGRLRLHFPEQAGPRSGEDAALQAYADALAAALHDKATHDELNRLIARSVYDAQHDPLTGLLNRSALLTRGETTVQLLPDTAPVALLLVDVDHFREINDTLGHAAGDEVLTVTAQRLRDATRQGELLARLGGDEFALLVTELALDGPGAEEVRRRAIHRGRELVSLLAEEASIRGVPVSIEASIGVVVASAGTADVSELLRRADAAMYQAKHGGATVSWYDTDQDAGSPDRPALLAELRRALDREDELVLALQPVIDLATGAPTGVEALVRWRHPRRGLLPPAEFVRAVEHSDLLGRFTEYVIDKALAAAAGWAKRGPAVPVAVNLSARSLLDPRLPEAVAALLRKHKVPGRRLMLEITETVVTSELPGIDEALTSLRALGVRLAVDDFGTGFASLTFLTRVPLDEVKVDGTFVARMAGSAEAAAIIRTTVELGRDLGMRVVAEGVETAAQRQMLTTLGCPAGQGCQLASPTSVERIGETLRTMQAAATRARVIPLAREGRVAEASERRTVSDR